MGSSRQRRGGETLPPIHRYRFAISKRVRFGYAISRVPTYSPTCLRPALQNSLHRTSLPRHQSHPLSNTKNSKSLPWLRRGRGASERFAQDYVLAPGKVKWWSTFQRRSLRFESRSSRTLDGASAPLVDSRRRGVSSFETWEKRNARVFRLVYTKREEFEGTRRERERERERGMRIRIVRIKNEILRFSRQKKHALCVSTWRARRGATSC